jgi:ankyrin repeat protein
LFVKSIFFFLFLFISLIFSQSVEESLVEATRDGNLPKIRLLSKNKSSLIQEDNRLMTPLLIACNDNNLEAVKILLEAGSDINKKHRENGKTPLILASANGYVDLVRFLITKSGVLINAKDKEGRTALIHSVSFARKDVLAVLIEAGANVNSRTNSDDSALSIALKGGRSEIVAILKQAGAKE